MKKGQANIFLIALVVLVAAGLGYFLARTLPRGISPVSPAPSSLPACQILNWQDQIPKIQNILTTSGFGPSSRPVSVNEQLDLNADGCLEAVIDTGTGGAYTTTYALFMFVAGEPVLAKAKDDTGETNPVILPAGASVKNQLGYELRPEKNGFVSFAKEYKEAADQLFLFRCEVNAYEWDSAAALFASSDELSESAATTICAN